MTTGKYRAALGAHRDAVRQEIIATLNRIDDERHATLAGQVHDTKDHAIAQLLVETGNAELQRAASELRDIDSALQRVSAGTYGRCVGCGTAIPESRLSACLTAERCMPCQAEHEQIRSPRT